ncbi:MAG TPA: NmrA family NAD(P)-binding protein [Bradyrhizobium sp.]|nr:NmrA family NAD(P)-binding protein [Bradyrhizobium sp.]
MAKPVLVTSAAGGRQGKTGRHVSEMLLARGVPVRAFVHTIDERSERLRALGAEIFEGDFLNIRSVQRATEGVSAIYFAYPVQDGLMDATATMALAAREAKVTRLVNLVMLQSSPDAPTPRMRQNYLSEQAFEWAGIGVAHIRATVFYENVAALVRQSLPAQGAIRLPWGGENTVLPLVGGEDVARVAVGLLTGPQPAAGSIVRMIGATMSLQEIVVTFARVLARNVHYQEISDEEWRREAASRNYNPHAIEHLSSLWRAIRGAAIDPKDPNFAITDSIEKIGGTRPKTFETFVREGQSELLAKSA